jgi:membrane protease YdiL (CAAX protease family)
LALNLGTSEKESKEEQPTSVLKEAVVKMGRERSLHDRRALYAVTGLLALLVFTVILGLLIPKYSDLYIFGYIMAIVYAVSGPLHRNIAWSDLGIKRGFVRDFKKVWYYFAIDAILFQLLSPMLGVAYLFGYYPQLLQHITGRLATDFGGAVALNGLLLGILTLSAVLTLMEGVVFRVVNQQRLSWFIGTPAAIAIATVIFGLAHALGTTGILPVVALDVGGVMLDGIFFGIIFAKTENLAVTWTTHYAADIVGILSLLTVSAIL